MSTYDQRISLLLELISFSVVDGNLHPREYDFLLLVAKELDIDRADFDDLFRKELPKLIIKSEFQRIQQFYRLALLMYSDGVLDAKEDLVINKITIDMGLNPVATKRILEMMKKTKNGIIDPVVLLDVFKEQHN
jgi:uncharacterized tellurite resistance protein B-like protein